MKTKVILILTAISLMGGSAVLSSCSATARGGSGARVDGDGLHGGDARARSEGGLRNRSRSRGNAGFRGRSRSGGSDDVSVGAGAGLDVN